MEKHNEYKMNKMFKFFLKKRKVLKDSYVSPLR